jgi:hypothetical protein
VLQIILLIPIGNNLFIDVDAFYILDAIGTRGLLQICIAEEVVNMDNKTT